MELNEIELMKKFLELYYSDTEIPIPSLEESALNGLFYTQEFRVFRLGAITALRDLAEYAAYETAPREAYEKESGLFQLGYLTVKTLRVLKTPGLFAF